MKDSESRSEVSRGASESMPPTVAKDWVLRIRKTALLFVLFTALGCKHESHPDLATVRAYASLLEARDSVVSVTGTLLESEFGLSLRGRAFRRIADNTDTLAIDVEDTLPIGRPVTIHVRVHRMAVPFLLPVVYLVAQKSNPSFNSR